MILHPISYYMIHIFNELFIFQRDTITKIFITAVFIIAIYLLIIYNIITNSFFNLTY